MDRIKARVGRSALLIALVASLGFGLTACGGGSGGTSNNASGQAGSDTSGSGTSTGSGSTPTVPSTGSNPTPTPTPTPTPSNPSSPSGNVARTIDYYGDSTIWGYASGSGRQVAKPAPVAFAEALPASSNFTVRNEGVNSTDACQLLNGSDGKHPSWEQQMANTPASIVIINHGINDEWRYDVNTYKGCLQNLAQIAKGKGKKVIFETPNPTRDSNQYGLDVYVNAMKDVASQQNVPVIDQYQYLKNYLGGQSVYAICPDGLHPTDAVYIMKGKYAASVFATLSL